jgi:hypothetical protein
MRRARGGLLRMSVEAGVMPVERRGQVTRIRISRVNGQPEELEGLDGRRQPSLGGTSRISRETYVRFCERLGVRLPGPTRPKAGQVEPALRRRRRSHSPAAPRCLRTARYGRARRDPRRTDGVFGWHRNKRTYKRKRNGERGPASRRTAVEYLKRGESRVTGQPAADVGRGRQPAKTVGEERKPDE